MSIDIFDMVLPKPLPSVMPALEEALRTPGSKTIDFWISRSTVPCSLLLNPTVAGLSGSLLRAIVAIPGLILPAEAGFSGSLVRRFGRASCEKRAGSSELTGARVRGPGEPGREQGPLFRLTGSLPADGDRAAAVAGDDETPGMFCRRIGVDGRELDRTAGDVTFVEGSWGRAVGVEGLELCEGRDLSPAEERLGRVFAGLAERA